MSDKKGPVLLCILDGVGIGAKDNSNAIHVAETPTLDLLNSRHPNSQLRADGEFVGVPNGQMGNSEIGHITIGTGRIIQQSLVKITNDLKNNNFHKRAQFQQFIEKSKNKRAIHVVGLLSDGGIHSHIEHALDLCRSLNQLNKPIYVHAISDGRDTDINAALSQICAFENDIQELKNVQLASIIGRYYAMDRDNRWDRIQKAWDLYTQGKGNRYDNAQEAIQHAYDQGLSDEHIEASLINNIDNATINDNDAVFFFNFRGDRMREINRCFLGFEDVGFDCIPPQSLCITAMSQYDAEFNDKSLIIYPPETSINSLGEVIDNAGLKQLRIAETEKYAHVTFFFNDGREEPFTNEERTLIPSPRDVKTYDLKPEMSLPKLTEDLINIINTKQHNFIALNIANADMVGHTGDFNAAVKAVEHIDKALGKILTAIKSNQGEAIIIADHGNIEQMSIQGKASTTHSTNPVPCIYYGNKTLQLKNGGLADVAPTILTLLNLDIPKQMTGQSLIK